MTWLIPAELVEIGFSRSRVVMMNEAHNGWLRCPRTRVVGRQILPTAHRMGVRHLAMGMLVWCGNSHLSKESFTTWTPMGYLFTRLGGGDFFALDQTATVNIHPERPSELDPALAATLESLGGTAGFLAGDQPPEVTIDYADRGMDAFLFSTENDMA